VVGGWHPGERGRAGQLGSLLLGYYEDAALRYAGKVGTGFKARELDRLAGLRGALAADETSFTPTRQTGPMAGSISNQKPSTIRWEAQHHHDTSRAFNAQTRITSLRTARPQR
jgi:ATP-dependent DNA ligase